MKTKLPTARDIMVERIETVRADAEIDVAIRTLLEQGHSGAPVLDADGVLVGVLSEHDCVRVLAESIAERRPEGHVRDHMSSELETVRPGDDILALASRYTHDRHLRLLVVEDGRLVGLIIRINLPGAL